MAPPRFAGRYAFREELGHGASGRVLLVADTAQQDVLRALKIVPPDEGARLRWEFDVLVGIAHPHVASVHELLRVERPLPAPFRLFPGDVVLVEQYVPGEGADRVADRSMDGEAARIRFGVRVGVALARGLSVIHGAGLVHGDVKPANVLAGPEGEDAVLIDLGLARPPGFSSQVGGTPGYMAPEAWQGERSVATDLYALGATLHRLLTGRTPGGNVETRSVAHIVAHALSPWRARPVLPEGTPPLVAHLVESLLSPEPLERPATARDVVARLGAVAAELGMEDAGSPPSAVAADGAPSPAERAMAMRALPWVGEPGRIQALVSGLASGGVVSVVGPPGSGRSRLVAEGIRAFQAQRADEDRPVPTAIRTEGALPQEPLTHDALVHVQEADAVTVEDARGLVRAAEVEGAHLTVIMERSEVLDVDPPLETVTLGPLSELQTGQLLACALGIADPPPALVSAARMASGGLAGRLCRLLAAAEIDARDPRRPETFAEIGATGTAGDLALPDVARPVAELVAVAGGDLSPEDALSLLDEGTRSDLLVADGLATLTSAGNLRLRGDVVRSLRRGMAPERKRTLATKLQGIRLGPEARAHVALAAGEHQVGLAGLCTAAHDRRRSGDPEGVIRLASEAIAEVAADDPALTADAEQALFTLRMEWADALRARGRYREAGEVLAPMDAAPARVLRAEVARLAGNAREAEHAVETVLARPELEGRVRVRAETLWGRLCLDRGALQEALQHAEAARERAASQGWDAEAARALEVAALVHAQRGELESTGRLAAEAVARARRAGRRDAEARARSIAASVALRTGRVHAAARGQVDAFELAEAAGERHAAAVFVVNVGLARLDAGEPGPALSALRDGARRLARLGRERDLCRALYNLANAAALVGDDEMAGTAARAALTAARATGDGAAEAWTRVVEADLAVRDGRSDAARAALQAAGATLGQLSDPAVAAVVAARCAVAWAAVDELEAATGVLDVARDKGREAAEDPVAQVEWHVAEARVALHRGDAQAARGHAMTAWATAEQAGAFEGRVRAGLVLADACAADGDGVGKAQALSEVRSLLDVAARTLEPDLRARMRAVPAYHAALASEPDARPESGGSEARWRRLVELAKRWMAEDRVGRLYEAVLEAAVELSGAERGFVVTRGREGDARVRAARGLARPHAQDQHGDVSRSIVDRALDGGQPVATLDALADERLRGAASIHSLALRSVLAVPFRVAGETAAALYLDDRLRPGAFGADTVQLMGDLVGLASAAIQSAERMRNERRSARRLTVLQRKLERTVQTQAQELAALKRSDHEPLHGSGIVAHSQAMRRVLELSEKVAGAEVPVLITGESGTGKELVARALHTHGARKDAPFVTENCGAIPEALLESALFGHVRGAFTGAERARTGLFEAAHGGTLFLDEIGEMSPAMQAKLLRVVQDGEVRPVGGEHTRKVDVRLLAATHRDLAAMVDAGTFRQDLYYRLAVVTLALPALRERPEDIPVLVAHLLAKHGEGMRIDRAALTRLQRYPWPGNVRQLENEIQRAVLLADDVIREDHLSPALLEGAPPPPNDLDLKAQVAALERRLIHAALEQTGGNQTRAAERLGVSRYGLQKMMRRLDIRAKGA